MPALLPHSSSHSLLAVIIRFIAISQSMTATAENIRIDGAQESIAIAKRIRTRTGCWNCRRKRRKCKLLLSCFLSITYILLFNADYNDRRRATTYLLELSVEK